jgi:hypothetical protein
MAEAYLRAKAPGEGDIYSVFFVDKTKFQYPPTSLLLFHLLPKSWLSPEYFIKTETHTMLAGPPLAVFRAASQLAVLVTLAAVAAILEILLRRQGGDPASGRVARIAMVILLGLMYHPLVKAHQLGQVQVILNALTAAGVLAHVLGRRAWSGFLLGLCCTMKPQFGVLLVWALLRREWRTAGGFLAAVVPLGLASLASFGWENHMQYLAVIREIAKHGETFWTNQCANGFLNRLLGNGDPVNFSPSEFAPYHPLVHGLTVASSLLILALALFRRGPAQPENATLDLAAAIAAATLASPIAWEHHYGAFFALFALVLPACLERGQVAAKAGILLGLSYLAMGVAVFAQDSFFKSPWRGIAGSHLYFGALLLFGLLLWLRRKPASAQTTAPAAS